MHQHNVRHPHDPRDRNDIGNDIENEPFIKRRVDRIGRSGHQQRISIRGGIHRRLACALAVRDTAGSAATPAARCKNLRRGSFMAVLPKMQWDDETRPSDAPSLTTLSSTFGTLAGRWHKRRLK